MRLRTFRGDVLHRVLATVREEMGEDAVIVRTRNRKGTGRAPIEVVAVQPEELDRFRRRLEAPASRRTASVRADSVVPRPHIVALVGPTGAGKTTTTIKLAVHPGAYGERRVGLITVDTYRVAALEQLQTYAEIAGLPVEVVYNAGEVQAALDRLSHCDVVLVDTPGRSPRADRLNVEWRSRLREIDPDEVHLVLPATIRQDVGLALQDLYDSCGVTHLLVTKLDEVPNGSGVAELAEAMDLPARWVTDGQEVPTDLRPAVPRILASLGVTIGEDDPSWRVAV